MEPILKPVPLRAFVPSSRADRPRSRSERGFTLIETLVVLLIVAVLGAIVIQQFRGARAGTDAAIVKTTAQSFAESVDSFALDHAGRVPVLGSADWPTQAMNAGPRKPNPAATGGSATYLGRAIPEAVQGNRVAFVTTAVRAGTAPPATGTAGVIRYVTGPVVAPATVPTSYRIEVWATGTDKRLPARMTCYFGTALVQGVDRCA